MSKSGVALGYIGKIIRREREFRECRLKQALLDVTFKCNLRCQMCGVWCDENPRWKNELGEDEWLRVIDELADYGCERIYLSGGEPTILPGFGRMIKHANLRGMTVSFNSNGTRLGEWAHEICSYADMVYISIDAPDERHDVIRGVKGTFERAVNGIRQLLDYKRENSCSRPRIHISTVLTQTNADCIPDMVEFTDRLGADILSLHYVCASPTWAVEQSLLDGECVSSERFAVLDDEKLYVDADGLRAIREGLNNIPETKNVWVLADPVRSLPDESFETGIFPIKRCVNISNVLMVMPDGATTICPHLAEFSMGNVHDHSIRDIWESDTRRRLKNHLKKHLFPVCSNCSYFSCTLTLDQLFRIALHRRLPNPSVQRTFDHQKKAKV
ncbi:radical SAM protein [bacterium]|nr:radical SAM protein [bacterium]